MTGWHGWSVGDTALHIGPVPTRKSIALYEVTKGMGTVLAYFRSDVDARRALEVIDAIAAAVPAASPQPPGIPVDALTQAVETNARLLGGVS